MLEKLRAEEEGFTIIEVLVAAVILIFAALAVFITFAAGVHNIQRSRESQVGISVGQREMERARVQGFDSLGTAGLAAFSSNTKLPENRISTSGGKFYFNLKRTGTAEPRLLLEGGLEKQTTGVKAPDGTEVTVDRFVTCEETEATASTCRAKRVIIDVLPVTKANLANYQHAYYELQSTVVDPTP